MLVFSTRVRCLSFAALFSGIALLPINAQLLTAPVGKSANFSRGSTAQRLMLAATEPPAPGDRIEIRFTSRKIVTEIVTPDGIRINADNAKEVGFDWSDELDLVPLGEDTGHTLRVVFTRPEPVGNYVLEFRDTDPKQPARADARLVSRLADYAERIRSVHDLQIRAAPVVGSVDIPIEVASDFPKQANASFEIAVNSLDAKLTLKLPSGRVLSLGPGEHADYTLKTFNEHYPNVPDKDFTSIWAIPMDGAHAIVQLSDTMNGRYVIHVESAQKAVAVVTFGPLLEIAKAAGAEFLEQPQALKPRPGEVNLKVQLLPFQCYAGDKLAVIAKLPADAAAKKPEFVARIQTQRPLRVAEDGHLRYADPGPVEAQPLTMVREADGSWHGTVTIPEAGIARVSLRVSGETAERKPFREEILLTNSQLMVYPVVARVLSLSANPVDENGDGKFDRLDIIADLDVIEPGDYMMNFNISSGAGKLRPPAPIKALGPLARGHQTLTYSIPSTFVWGRLKDGPYLIGDLYLNRKDGGYESGVKVPDTNVEARTPAWKRDEWNPGRLYGDDTVTVHGLRPAPTGRFRFAEVQWQITTPGGQCSWNGSLRPQFTVGSEVYYTSSLPAGRTILSFIFDGAMVAAQNKSDWSFGAVIRCGRDELRVDAPKLAIDPAQYQAGRGYQAGPAAFSIHLTNPIRIAAGASFTVPVSIANASDPVGVRAESVPAGLTATLVSQKRYRQFVNVDFKIETAADTKPGRYVIPIVVDIPDKTTEAELLIDVVRP